jgi:hypothetical protein
MAAVPSPVLSGATEIEDWIVDTRTCSDVQSWERWRYYHVFHCRKARVLIGVSIETIGFEVRGHSGVRDEMPTIRGLFSGSRQPAAIVVPHGNRRRHPARAPKTGFTGPRK